MYIHIYSYYVYCITVINKYHKYHVLIGHAIVLLVERFDDVPRKDVRRKTEEPFEKTKIFIDIYHLKHIHCSPRIRDDNVEREKPAQITRASIL